MIAVVIGALIGAVYALLFNRLGMPSFVSTLAGLLAILGMQLYLLGATGSINLPYGSFPGKFRSVDGHAADRILCARPDPPDT